MYTVDFAKRGYVVATISYRLAQEAKFPAAVEDAKCAVRWMRSNATQLHVDPDRIAVLGGSAGGYLSLMVGYTAGDQRLDGHGGHEGTSSAVQAVVDLYGPTDLDTPLGRASDLVSNFLGKSFAEDPELYHPVGWQGEGEDGGGGRKEPRDGATERKHHGGRYPSRRNAVFSHPIHCISRSPRAVKCDIPGARGRAGGGPGRD